MPNIEAVPPGEAKAVQRLTDFQLGAMAHEQRKDKRGQHPKHQGCVRASFAVAADVPDALAVGVFKEARTYPAYIRFSNGKSDDDRKPDSHGMAIKLLGVKGAKLLDDEKDAETQDFVLADHNVFFARDVQHLLDFIATRLAAEASKSDTFGDWTVARIQEILSTFVQPPGPSPLEVQYWSQTPYLLGENAVKYSAKPVPGADPVAPGPGGDSPDLLREAMVERLDESTGTARRFDFLVQLRTDPGKMPIEDPTVAWDPGLAPFQKVATITVEPQTFDTKARMTFCENLSFTPWHSLPEHRPLGGINRARKAVYLASSALRHKENQVPRKEPTADAF